MSVGRSELRLDGVAKVTGAAQYPGDLAPPDALVAKVVFSGKAHARMVAMDTAAAEAVPGVVAVLTAKDVPVNEYGLTIFDQPVLVGLGDTGRSAVDGSVSRWDADHVAVVVAETEAAADEAAGLVHAHIEWDDLPVVADIDAALDDSVLVHEEVGTNTYVHDRIRKGDVAAGWAAAEVVVEAVYELPYQEHAYLQPEAAVSYVDAEGRVTVVVAGQWTHEDQEQIAHALDLPPERVRVIYPAIGGAFGGREDMSLQIVMALAAWRLHQRGERRAIRCRWSREESIVGHHKRHRGRVRARLGATLEGRITVVEADCWLDSGSYNYTTNKVLGNLHLTVAGPYEVPNARLDSYGVYTNAVPGGAFRGFGSPQGCFVAETQMNKLAEVLGMDPVEVRRRNLIHEGSVGITQAPFPPGVSIPEVVEACADAARWSDPLPERPPIAPIASLPAEADAVRRGRGFACAFKNVGFSFGFPERCEATLVLHGDADDERPAAAELFHAGAEVGQGAHTAFRQMAAEALGLPPDAIETHYSDTASAGDSGSASASRLTFMAGNSILGAAEEAEKRWLAGDRPAVGHFRYVPPPTEALDPETGECQPNFSYGYVAQAVDVSVDVETGHVVVHRVVNASDVGRVINPKLCVGQVEGGVVQAYGYAVTEDLQVEGAEIRNPRLSGYLIPGIGDVPERIDTVLLEVADPLGPFGARGMAEMPMIPLAPAIIAAVADATGVWFDRFPLTPSRVLAGLRGAGVPPGT
jgi:CO/xanthine dehydrogenase Mo-binding subunit